jgi:hypothetical protein
LTLLGCTVFIGYPEGLMSVFDPYGYALILADLQKAFVKLIPTLIGSTASN